MFANVMLICVLIDIFRDLALISRGYLNMQTKYPYPRMKDDGYKFEAVEQDKAVNHPFLRYAIPSDDARFAVKPGDVVKLIFMYREHVERGGETISAEHMWVRVIDYGEGCLIGQLDNAPPVFKHSEGKRRSAFSPETHCQILDKSKPLINELCGTNSYFLRALSSKLAFKSSSETVLSTPLGGISTFAIHNRPFNMVLRKLSSAQFL